MAQPLNLQNIVDKALASSPHPDPHVVARSVLMRIPVESRSDAMLIALAAYVEARVLEAQNDPQPTVTCATVADVRSP